MNQSELSRLVDAMHNLEQAFVAAGLKVPHALILEDQLELASLFNLIDNNGWTVHFGQNGRPTLCNADILVAPVLPEPEVLQAMRALTEIIDG